MNSVEFQGKEKELASLVILLLLAQRSSYLNIVGCKDFHCTLIFIFFINTSCLAIFICCSLILSALPANTPSCRHLHGKGFSTADGVTGRAFWGLLRCLIGLLVSVSIMGLSDFARVSFL